MNIENYRSRVALLNKWKVAYDKAVPIALDSEYDKVRQEVLSFENEHSEVEINEGDAFRQIETTTGDKRPHIKPMLSIKDIFTTDDAKKWYDKVKSNVVIEDKLDGIALSITYKDNMLVSLITRGNGEVGTDLTRFVNYIKNIPKEINNEGLIEVRGEVVIPKKLFDSMAEDRLKFGGDPLTVNRSLVGGTLNSADPMLAKSRGLEFIAHGIGFSNKSYKSELSKLSHLTSLGFKVVHARKLDITKLEQYYNTETKKRNSKLFEVDGLVLKVNNVSKQEQLGYSAKHPNYMIALKYQAEVFSTVVESIEWGVGTTGELTPVAIVSPVEILGTTVSRATVHNKRHMQLHKIAVGAKVAIIKSGDIIPKILYSMDTDENTIVQLPTHCPGCGTELFETEVNLVCTNHDCIERKIKKLTRFVNIKNMNMKGISESFIRTVVSAGLVTKYHDLFKLTIPDLTTLGMGEKQSANAINAIRKAMITNPDRLLSGLGIEGIGITLSKLIVNQLGLKFDEYEIEDLLEVGVYHKEAEAFVTWMKYNYIDEVKPLLDIIELVKPEKKMSGFLTGFSISITGTLPYKRRVAEKRLSSEGAEFKNINSNTNIVIIGGNPGPAKLNKINKLKLSYYDVENNITYLNANSIVTEEILNKVKILITMKE